MINIVLGLIVATLAILGMSIGLVLKKKPLQPSCGGVYLSKGDTCGVCGKIKDCLLYTSPSPRDLSTSRMPSSA